MKDFKMSVQETVGERIGENKNPFIYGKAVTGKELCDREDEIRKLTQIARDSGRIFILSPRRYGKSSLILALLESLKNQGFLTAYIDLSRVTSYRELMGVYSTSIAKAAEKRVEKVVDFIKKVSKGIRPVLSFDHEGKPIITLEYSLTEEQACSYLSAIYDLPDEIAKRRDKKFVVAFDEFQEIRNLNGEQVEKAMRSHFQFHYNTAYIFSGSKTSILTDMISNANRAFYKMGDIMVLNKLPHEVFKRFLEKKFIESGFTLRGDVMEKILSVTREIPYNAQFLCHKLWERYLPEKEIDEGKVEELIAQTIFENYDYYLGIWDTLSGNEKKVIKAMAFHEGEDVLTDEFCVRVGFGLEKLREVVQQLGTKGLVVRERRSFFIVDFLFREWIRREFIRWTG